MVKKYGSFFCDRKGDLSPIAKHIIYLILIAAFALIIWLIVNGIIRKLLTLY